MSLHYYPEPALPRPPPLHFPCDVPCRAVRGAAEQQKAKVVVVVVVGIVQKQIALLAPERKVIPTPPPPPELISSHTRRSRRSANRHLSPGYSCSSAQAVPQRSKSSSWILTTCVARRDSAKPPRLFSP